MRTILAVVAAAAALAAPIVGGQMSPTDPASAELTLERTEVPVMPWTGLKPCASEDGPGPCFWDASQAGNGVGESFWIAEDFCTYRYVAGQAVRDADFECTDAYAS